MTYTSSATIIAASTFCFTRLALLPSTTHSFTSSQLNQFQPQVHAIHLSTSIPGGSSPCLRSATQVLLQGLFASQLFSHTYPGQMASTNTYLRSLSIPSDSVQQRNIATFWLRNKKLIKKDRFLHALSALNGLPFPRVTPPRIITLQLKVFPKCGLLLMIGNDNGAIFVDIQSRGRKALKKLRE